MYKYLHTVLINISFIFFWFFCFLNDVYIFFGVNARATSTTKFVRTFVGTIIVAFSVTACIMFKDSGVGIANSRVTVTIVIAVDAIVAFVVAVRKT